MALRIAATRVRTGHLLPFRQDELTADIVLASADLLPHAGSARPTAALASRLRRLRLHRVDGGSALAHFRADNKTNTSPAFLERLFDVDQQTADTWLQQHRHDLGRRSR